MSGSIVIFSVASLLLIGAASAQDGLFGMVGSAIDGGFGSFTSSSFGPNFGGGGFESSNFGGELLKNVPGSNFVGTIVTSTTNADGITEVTQKVTDGLTSVVADVGDLPDSELPVVNDIVEKIVPEVIGQVSDDLNKGLGIEKIVDNVVDSVGDVVNDANLGKIVGPLLIKILTNRRMLRAVIKAMVLLVRLGVL